MGALPRRRFVLQLASLAPLPFVARRLHRFAVADLDPRMLRALGAAILPTELGPAGLERTVSGFERWLAGYREGVELVHGYGTAEIRKTGPSPALRWSTQLRELEASAQNRGSSFAQLSVADRQELVRAALKGGGGGGAGGGQRLNAMPAVDRAAHVSVGLLAFFYGSPEATDLCYQVRIGANSCRPLADSERRPLPLASS